MSPPGLGGDPTGGQNGNFVIRILIKIADERFSARGPETRVRVKGLKCNIMMADVASHIVK